MASIFGSLGRLLGGSPLHTLTDALGVTHGLPSAGMTNPSALLGQPTQGQGQELPPAGQGQDIVVTGQQAAPAPAPADAAPQAPMPSANFGMMGAATPARVGPADPGYVARMRERQKNAEELYRQTYHPNSEFGTHGILRDIIGNVSDFGRHLLGFDPRYNEEKWAEKAGNMASSDPEAAAASRQAAMQYNSRRTMEYGKELEAEQARRVSSAATAEYKGSQAAFRNAQLLTGLGANLVAVANSGATPEQVQAQYDRARPAIQKALNDTYGPGVMQAPEQFDPAFVAGLTRSGYSGSNYQRQTANIADNATRRAVAEGRNLTAIEVARIGADARRYAADAAYRASVNNAVLKGQPIETVVEEEPTGSIVMPGKRKVTTVTRSQPGVAPAQAPAPQRGSSQSGPPVGYRSPAGFTFHGGDPKDPKNWSK